jgi:hypothetical protein
MQVTRIRRGKVVVVPPEWVGRFPTEQTMRKRPSHALHKLRKRVKGVWLADGTFKWKDGPRRAEQRRVREEGA